jgi:chaperonin GroEL (HSP60 family)
LQRQDAQRSFRPVDPTKVVRVALQDAASVASLIITTEAGITGAA